jgi:hypothetical protein
VPRSADPLAKSNEEAPPLFRVPTSTSTAAGAKAAISSGSWRERILRRLEERPSALFEVADHYGVPDHVISGRFTELARDGYIEHAGERRRKPQTDCDAEVWRLKRSLDQPMSELLGYPLTLAINNELHDRQELLPNESYPGIPYARRADNGGLRRNVRVAIVECDGCGKPLFLQEEKGEKKFRCVNSRCGRVWRVRAVAEPGRGAVLALVMEEY